MPETERIEPSAELVAAAAKYGIRVEELAKLIQQFNVTKEDLDNFFNPKRSGIKIPQPYFPGRRIGKYKAKKYSH